MNIKNIEIVSELNKELKVALKKYNVINAQLQPNRKGHYNYGQQVRIGIGGDTYGNGELARIVMNVSESVDAKRVLIKMKSDAWGVVVGLRVDLRTFGVILEQD